MRGSMPSTRLVLPALVVALLVGLAATQWHTPGLMLWWLHPLGLAWWALALALLPRDRVAIGITAVAVLLRALTFSPRVHMHFDRAWLSFLEASGRHQARVDSFGEAWPALMGWSDLLLGPATLALHVTNAVMSVLAVPLLVGAVRASTGDGRGAALAGLLLAATPLALVMAPTDSRFVAAGTLMVAGLYGVLRRDAAGDALGALSTGLLAHLRPELGAFSGVLLVAGAWGRRPGMVVPAAALVGWRVAALALGGQGGSQWNLGAISGMMGQKWFGVGGAFLVTDPTRDPAVVAVLALAGALLALRRRDGSVWMLLLGLLGTVAYAYQWREADRLRYHLTVVPWLAALAGLAGSALWARSRTAALAVGLALAASWWPTRVLWAPLAWSEEYGLARTALAAVPEGAVVRYDPAMDRNGHFVGWASLYTPAAVRPLEGPVAPGELRWVGLADYAHGRKPDVSGLEPVEVRTFDARWADMADYGPFEVTRPTVGLYRPRAAP